MIDPEAINPAIKGLSPLEIKNNIRDTENIP
jgi:hypothetical protein